MIGTGAAAALRQGGRPGGDTPADLTTCTNLQGRAMATETVTVPRKTLVDLRVALDEIGRMQTAIHRICEQQPEDESVLAAVWGIRACVEAMECAMDQPEDALDKALASH